MTDLECPRLFLKLIPAPFRTHLLGDDCEITLELLGKREIERRQICESCDSEVEMEDVILVRVGENLPE